MVRQARGYKGTLLLAFEDEYGITPALPTVYMLPFNSNSLAGSQEQIQSNTITGRRDPVEPGEGTIDCAGTIVVPMDVRNSGIWLTLLLNEPTTTNENTAGKLTGATGVTTTIGTWNAVTAGAFKVSIDGSAATDVGPIDFSTGATTMPLVASKIQTAIRAVATGGFTNATAAWDNTNTRFIITSGTSGNSSSVSALSAPATNTDISGTGFIRGTNGTTTAGKTLYKHIWKLTDDMPSATIEKGFGDLSSFSRCPGVKISKFSLSAQMGNNELTASIDVMAATETFTDTTLSDNPTEHVLKRFNNTKASVKENGVFLADCRKMDIVIDSGLDGDTYCFSETNTDAVRTALNEGMVQVTGNVETLFKSMTLLNKAINNTKSGLALKLVNGDHYCEIEAPELKFKRTSPGVDGPKGILLSLDYTGFYQEDADNSAVVVTLVNDVPSYAI
ncbi:MAG: hypothetical protein K0Q85_28 [Caproiciproducens sp.]|jgi:hypothetical protein|nr:hypothetical protein [Caproiciproducens sp.]